MQVTQVEQKILEILLDPMHLYLIIGIMSFIYILKTITPLSFLFIKKWKWIISFINISLSSIGIFLLKMTSAETFGVKICFVLLISTVTTFSYQLTKPILEKIFKKFFGIEAKPST